MRFHHILFLAGVFVLVPLIMNKWIFWSVVVLGLPALAVVIWKLVERGMFVPPTILIDEVKEKFNKDDSELEPGQGDLIETHRNQGDEK